MSAKRNLAQTTLNFAEPRTEKKAIIKKSAKKKKENKDKLKNSQRKKKDATKMSKNLANLQKDDEEEDSDMVSENERYEVDDFVVNDNEIDDGEELEDSEVDGKHQDTKRSIKIKHKRIKKCKPLDEEELELLKENGIKVTKETKRKRLHKNNDSIMKNKIIPLEDFEDELLENKDLDEEEEEVEEEEKEHLSKDSESPKIKKNKIGSHIERMNSNNLQNKDNYSESEASHNEYNEEEIEELEENILITEKQLEKAFNIFGDNFQKFSNLRIKRQPKLVNSDNLAQKYSQFDSKAETNLEFKSEAEETSEILNQDCPERILKNLKFRYKIDESDLKDEVEWIGKISKFKNLDGPLKELLSSSNTCYLLLKLLLIQKLELPYILKYEECFTKFSLSYYNIFQIMEIDKEWDSFNQFKTKLYERFLKIRDFLSTRTDKFNYYFLSAITYQDLKDLDEAIEFYEIYNSLIKFETINIPSKYKILEQAVKLKLDEFCSKFALNPYQFIRNFQGESFISPNSAKETEEELIRSHKEMLKKSCVEFKDIDNSSLINIAKKFLSLELSVQPCIKSYIKEKWLNKGLITTSPTIEGKVTLDFFHPLFKVKNICRKGILEFTNDLYYYMKRARQSGFINVNYIDDNEKSDFENLLINKYLDQNNIYFHKWDMVRKEILSNLIGSYIIPYYNNVVESILEITAENYVISESSHALYNLLYECPYRPSSEIQKNNEKGIIVMSFIIDNEELSNIQSAVVNENGELIDHTIFNNVIFKKIKEDHSEFKKLESEKQRCLNFIVKYNPDLIVVGANSLNAKSLIDVLRKIVEDKNSNILSNDSNQNKVQKETWCMFSSMQVSKIFSTSRKGKTQMKDASELLRAAISLCRYKQNPLTEVLNLWSNETKDNDILLLPLHYFQSEVDKYKLETALEITASYVVSSIGIDLKKSLKLTQLQVAIPFLPGLGQKRGPKVINLIKKLNSFQFKRELKDATIDQFKFQEICFSNLYPFIQVQDSSTDFSEYLSYIDLTRIPSNWAQIIIESLQKISCEKLNVKKLPKNKISYEKNKLKEAFQSKEVIEEFSRNILNLSKEKGIWINSNFIIEELKDPFLDKRVPITSMNPKELFYDLIGETIKSFHVGQIVPCEIIKIEDKVIKLKLQNGIIGICFRGSEMNEERSEDDPLFLNAKEGRIVEARIVSIKEDKFQVVLKTNEEEMITHERYRNFIIQGDNSIKIDVEDLKNKKYELEKQKQYLKFSPRTTTNKYFINSNFFQTSKKLKNQPVGDFLFRPSSTNENGLKLCIKVDDNILYDINITEFDKSAPDLIGNILKIDDLSFNTLEEIKTYFVDPFVSLIHNCRSNKKYLSIQDLEEMDEYLIEQKNLNQNPFLKYCFSISPENPKLLILAYLVDEQKILIVKECAKFEVQNLKFHGKEFQTIDDLVCFFKVNMKTEEYQSTITKIKVYSNSASKVQKNNEKNQKTLNSKKEDEWENCEIDPNFNQNINEDLDIPMGQFQTNDEDKDNNVKTQNFSNVIGNNNNERNASKEEFYQGKESRKFNGPKNRNTEGFSRPFNKSDKTFSENNFQNENLDGPSKAGKGWGEEAKVQTSDLNWTSNSKPINSMDSWSSNNNGNIIDKTQAKDDSWGHEFSSNISSNTDNKSFRGNKSGNFQGKGRKCFNCQQEGHISKDCPNKGNAPKKNEANTFFNKDKAPKSCFNCGQTGHFSKECPYPRSDKGQRSKGFKNPSPKAQNKFNAFTLEEPSQNAASWNNQQTSNWGESKETNIVIPQENCDNMNGWN